MYSAFGFGSETNKTTNLTRILNVEDAAVLHILDSLVLLPISIRLLRELCSIWEQVRASLVFLNHNHAS